MKNIKDEISKLRLVIIQRRHSLGSIKKKAEEMEKIGTDLRMRDFDLIYTDIYNLGKKIEGTFFALLLYTIEQFNFAFFQNVMLICQNYADAVLRKIISCRT